MTQPNLDPLLPKLQEIIVLAKQHNCYDIANYIGFKLGYEPITISDYKARNNDPLIFTFFHREIEYTGEYGDTVFINDLYNKACKQFSYNEQTFEEMLVLYINRFNPNFKDFNLYYILDFGYRKRFRGFRHRLM